MKELSIEQKAKAYDEAIEKFDVILNLNTVKESGTIFADDVRKILPELQESEDERIRKSLIDMLKNDEKCYLKEIAWLEKQGEHANFRDSIQVGDKVTRNEDGVLVNLSQLNRVAKKDGKQDGHTAIPADAVLDSNKDGLIADTIRCKRENQCEQKPWSEEDELCLTETLYLIRNSYSVDDKVERLSNWVKSIKDRLLPQLKQEWSEEDENLLKLSIENLTELKDRFGEEYGKVGDCIVLLESIKERCTWKPSKEQISVLSRSLKYINTISPNYCHVLKELLAQLNKLREE